MQTFCYTRHKEKESFVEFLAKRFPYQSEAKWRDCILSGQVRINSQKVPPETILDSKDIISYKRPRESEPVIDDNYAILYQDATILVVEKSGNIPISESGKYHKNTLINILKEQCDYSELYAVHRLDKETSGLVLIARTKETATRLGEQFVNGIPQKKYHAVLIGEMDEKETIVDQPIRKGSTEETKIRIRQVVSPEGKPSKTRFIPLAVSNGLSLSEIKTYTGRTHQIRCHAEFIGYPILGDKLYGQADDFFISLLEGRREPVFKPFGRIDRQLLHASELSFKHPQTDEWMTMHSDYRKVFNVFPAVKRLIEAK